MTSASHDPRQLEYLVTKKQQLRFFLALFVEKEAIQNETPYPSNFESFDEAILSVNRVNVSQCGEESVVNDLYP